MQSINRTDGGQGRQLNPFDRGEIILPHIGDMSVIPV